MELVGLPLSLLVLFVSFSFTVGVLFGFFGMGESFLITPILLILDYKLGAILFVVLLAGIGALFLCRASKLDDGDDDDDEPEDTDDEIPTIGQQIQSYTVPPMISLTSGGRVTVDDHGRWRLHSYASDLLPDSAE